MYLPEYKNSWAIVIGINSYQYVLPLSFATNDAEAIARILSDRFAFQEDKINLLVDEAATREAILGSFLELAQVGVGDNDRVLVFFAGHGHTRLGRRGEVGYLVPVDGTPDNLATLLRWDDLTKNADLIPAKHLLFIMDACYGGLATTRAPAPGSMRFLKDMLQRYSRQVLTAGKANEVVADSGGPIPGHSVFTGHLLQALQGNAATDGGIISANSVMAYVYDKVAKDLHSNQTPHYGFVDGDGDFIFAAPILEALSGDSRHDEDVLIEIPPITSPDYKIHGKEKLIESVKEYISDIQFRIKLDDLVTNEIKKVLYLTTYDEFPVQTTGVTPEEFAQRLNRYESILANLQSIVILLAHWGTEEHIPALRKAVARIVDNEKLADGKTVWIALRWYPSILLLYSGGIAAIASGEYENLSTLFMTKVGSRHSGEITKDIITTIIDAMMDLERTEIFKTLPGHKQYYVPKSEYLFKVLQPTLDELLFLGKSYEVMFDRFEVFFALVYADLDLDWRRDNCVWGPPGRFAWKYRRRGQEGSPLIELIIEEAKAQGPNWPPLRTGLFGGSVDRFLEIAQKYLELVGRLKWH